MDEYQPAPAAAVHRQQQQQQRQGSGRGASGAGSEDDDLPLLPDDVDLEEQRMLMAAIQGGGYEGQIPGKAEMMVTGCRMVLGRQGAGASTARGATLAMELGQQQCYGGGHAGTGTANAR